MLKTLFLVSEAESKNAIGPALRIMAYSQLIQLPRLGLGLGIQKGCGGKLMKECYCFPHTISAGDPVRIG